MMNVTPSGGTKRLLQEDSVDSEQVKKRREDSIHSLNQLEGNEEEVFYDSSWLYMDCSYCNMHMPDLLGSRFHGEKLVLQMHAQYSVFSKSSRGDRASKEDVRIFKDEFLQKVCSLRNERGGVLIIHITGKSADKGPSLDDFDQKVGEELSRMVEDDTLYVENYDRRWYSHYQIGQDDREDKQSQMVYLDFIIVNVKGSSSVSTKDFNTLVTWDGSKERPKAREISRLLWRTNLQPCFASDKSTDGVFKEGDRIDLYESRDVQLKRMIDKDLEKDLQDDPSLAEKSLAYRIAFRLKEKLHLLEYITSFTKLRTGGSFYCGIEEEKQKVVVVTDKSKTSKSKKKKKKKGHGPKVEGEEEKEEDRDPVENVTQSKDSQVPEKKNAEISSKNFGLDSVKAESKSGLSDSVNTTKIAQDRDPCFPPNIISSQLNEVKEKSSMQSLQTPLHKQSSLLPDSKEPAVGTDVSNCQVQNAQTVGNGIKEIMVQKSEMSVSTTPVKSDVPSVSVIGDVKMDVSSHSENKDYKTAHNMVKGFKLTQQDREELKTEIMTSIQKDMLWLQTDGSRLSAEQISDEIEVHFYCTSEADETYVTEIWVKKVFGGIVFYKSYGPDAYRLTGISEKRPRVVRMNPSEWIRLLRKAMQCDNCDKPIWKLQPDEDEDQF